MELGLEINGVPSPPEKCEFDCTETPTCYGSTGGLRGYACGRHAASIPGFRVWARLPLPPYLAEPVCLICFRLGSHCACEPNGRFE